MNGGAKSLLDGANRTFNFTDVGVGWNNVEFNREEFTANAFELVITVKIANNETSSAISAHHVFGMLEDGGFGPVVNGGNGAVAYAAGDTVVERQALDIKEIGADGDVPVKLKNGSGNGNRFESGNVGRGRGTMGGAFKVRYVGSVDDESTFGVVGSDGAIANEVAAKDGLELCFRRSSDHTIKVASAVGCANLAIGEKFLLPGYSSNKSVSSNVIVNVRVVYVQATVVFHELHDSAVDTVKEHCRLGGGVHSDATDLAGVGKREDIRDRIRIVPNGAKVRELPDEVRILETAICHGTEHMWTGSDVG